MIFESLLLVELVVHGLNRLHQSFWVLRLYPFTERAEVELAGHLLSPQPLEVVNEYLISVLFLEYAVDEVAAEELHLHLRPQHYVLVDYLVGLAEDVPHHQSVGLLELLEGAGHWGVVVFQSWDSLLLGYVALYVLAQSAHRFLRLLPALLPLLAAAHQRQTHLPDVVLEAQLFPLTQELEGLDLPQYPLNKLQFVLLKPCVFV